MKKQISAHQNQGIVAKKATGKLREKEQFSAEYGVSEAVLQTLGHRPIHQIGTASDGKKQGEK
ncbi:MAG: hypothetical protein ABSH48_24660 [Verrucomicrobiota bacterium]|jgi:hypothetical protein